MAVYPLTDWGALQLRLSAFTVEPERREESTWWAQVVGSEPEASVTRKVPPPSRLEQSGAIEQGGRLILRVAPTRIDWLLVPSEQMPGGAPDVVGQLPDVLPPFLELAKKWAGLPDRPRIQRLALGASLIHAEPTAKSGFERLGEYLPAVKLDAEKSHDFLFQINRPVISARAVPELMINRLSKWSLGTFQTVDVNPTGVFPHETTVTVLELDINTSAHRQDPLPDPAFNNLIDELGEYAIAIASDGDRL
jgi:hypothetical protein